MRRNELTPLHISKSYGGRYLTCVMYQFMFAMRSKSYIPNLQCWSSNGHSPYNTLNMSAGDAFLLIIFPFAQLQAVKTLSIILDDLLNLFLQAARVARMVASFFGPQSVPMVPYRAFDCVHLRVYSLKAQSVEGASFTSRQKAPPLQLFVQGAEKESSALEGVGLV
jgi:hypothetical protein